MIHIKRLLTGIAVVAFLVALIVVAVVFFEYAVASIILGGLLFMVYEIGRDICEDK